MTKTALIGALLLLAAPAAAERLRLALASTLDYTGLGSALADGFAGAGGCGTAALAAASRHGIELLSRGDVDAAVSHAPTQERIWQSGDVGRQRIGILDGEFILAGPADDPAGVGGAGLAEAFSLIRAGEAAFLSRDDGSGTHAMEMRIWAEAGGEPGPEAGWHRRAARQQGAALQIADQTGAYTLTDLAALLRARQQGVRLAALARDEPPRANRYSLLIPAASKACALELAGWLGGGEAAELIGEFSIGGERPYRPSSPER